MCSAFCVYRLLCLPPCLWPLKYQDSCGGHRPPFVCSALCVYRLLCVPPCLWPLKYQDSCGGHRPPLCVPPCVCSALCMPRLVCAPPSVCMNPPPPLPPNPPHPPPTFSTPPPPIHSPHNPPPYTPPTPPYLQGRGGRLRAIYAAKVTIAGKKEIYNQQNLIKPFLVHHLLGPPPPRPRYIHPAGHGSNSGTNVLGMVSKGTLMYPAGGPASGPPKRPGLIAAMALTLFPE